MEVPNFNVTEIRPIGDALINANRWTNKQIALYSKRAFLWR